MDIVSTTKKSFMMQYRVPLALLAVLLSGFLINQKVISSHFTTERSKLVIATVDYGDFAIKVKWYRFDTVQTNC